MTTPAPVVPANTVANAPPAGSWKSKSGFPIPDPPNKNSVGNNPDNWNISQSQVGTYYQYAIPVTTNVPAHTLITAAAWADLYYENKVVGFSFPYSADQQTQIVNYYNSAVQANCVTTGKTTQVPVDPGAAQGYIGPNPINSAINAAVSWEDVLSALGNVNTWKRVGEFAVGFLMLGIATYAIAKNLGGSAPAAQKTASTLKKAGTVVNPLSSPNRKARAVTGRQNREYRNTQARTENVHARRALTNDNTNARVTGHALREGARESAHQRTIERGQYRSNGTNVPLDAPIL